MVWKIHYSLEQQWHTSVHLTAPRQVACWRTSSHVAPWLDGTHIYHYAFVGNQQKSFRWPSFSALVHSPSLTSVQYMKDRKWNFLKRGKPVFFFYIHNLNIFIYFLLFLFIYYYFFFFLTTGRLPPPPPFPRGPGGKAKLIYPLFKG